MNTRLLGLFCVLGGGVYLLQGLRFLIAGGPVQDGLNTVVVGIWALGGICGVLGMIAVRATGTNAVIRLASHLPVVGFLMAFTGTLQLLDPAVQVSPLLFIGLLALAVGMLLNGFFTLFARVWHGWKKVVPFLPATMPFVGMAIGAMIGVVGGVNVSLVGLSWMLLGYVVMTSPAPAEAAVLATA